MVAYRSECVMAVAAILGLCVGCATVTETATVTRDPVTGEVFVDWSRSVVASVGGKADEISQERSGTVTYIDAKGKEVVIEFYSGQNIQGLTSPDVSVALAETVSKAVLGGVALGNQRREIEASAPPQAPSAEDRLLDAVTGRIGTGTP